MVVCRLGLVGHLVVGCRFWWGWVWIRRVGRGLPATWNVGRRVGVPGLRNPLPNATYTVDGRFHYTTDAWSRTVRLEVDMLGDVAERFRSRSDTVQGHVKDYGNELASKYDTKFNGGHIVGARSGGPSEELNTVTMLEEVNQYRVDSKLKSYYKFEQEIAADPENYRNLVVEFEYPDPVDPAKLANSEKVPIGFEASWTDSNGVLRSRPFENVLPRSKGD